MSYKFGKPMPAVELVRAVHRRIEVHLIDVRTPGEFDGGHIEGSHNVPLSELPSHAQRLARLSSPIVLVCRSGARARLAERMLQHAGARRLHVLDGGVLAWRDAGHSLVEVPASRGAFLRKAARLLGLGPRRDAAVVVDSLLAAAE